MKKNICAIFFTLFFLSQSKVFLLSIEEYKKLAPKEKIENIVEEFEGNAFFIQNMGFVQKSSILTENYKENIPLLINVLAESKITPGVINRFEIVQVILFNNFYDLLRSNDKKQIVKIYQEKIHQYLLKYKKIDIYSVTAERMMFFLGYSKFIPASKEFAGEMYEKYTNAGYANLVLDYEG